MEVWFILRIAILITIDATALFGNSLVCISVYKNPRLRDKIGTVVFALAVTDLLTSAIIVPLTTASLILSKNNINLKPEWVSGNESDVWCGIQGFFLYGLNAMSLFSMALAAFIRFLCVVKPNVYRRYVKTKTIILALVIIAMVITFIQSSLAIPGYGQYEFIWKFALCMFLLQGKYKPFRRAFEIVFTVIFFALPLMVIFVCYTVIFFTVRKHNRRVHIQTINSEQSFGQNLKTKWNKVFSFGPAGASVRKVKQNESTREELKPIKETSSEISDMSMKKDCDNTYDNCKNSQADSYKLSQGSSVQFPSRRKVNTINCTCLENIEAQDHKSIAENQTEEKLDTTKEAIPLTLFRASCNKVRDAQTKYGNTSDVIKSVTSDTGKMIDDHVTCANSKIENFMHTSGLETTNSTVHSRSYTHDVLAHKYQQNRDPHPPDSANSAPNSSQMSNHTAQIKPLVKGHVTEAKVTKTVLAVFVGFICCWIPAGLFFAISPYTDYVKSAPYAVLVPICGALSSAINPFIYGAADRRFRQTYRKVLKCENI